MMLVHIEGHLDRLESLPNGTRVFPFDRLRPFTISSCDPPCIKHDQGVLDDHMETSLKRHALIFPRRCRESKPARLMSVALPSQVCRYACAARMQGATNYLNYHAKVFFVCLFVLFCFVVVVFLI